MLETFRRHHAILYSPLPILSELPVSPKINIFATLARILGQHTVTAGLQSAAIEGLGNKHHRRRCSPVNAGELCWSVKVLQVEQTITQRKHMFKQQFTQE